MPATVVNVPSPGTLKLNRGRASNLGTIASTIGQAVQFTIPEPTYFNQGGLIIIVSSGITLGTGAFSLEVSIDGGNSWATLAGTNLPVAATGLLGDTAAVFGAQYNANGFGSGALFRFGVSTAATSGSSAVWALVG